MTTDKPKPRRRWLQFSLRTLFIVVTLFCVFFGTVAKRARDQRLAVETIQELGGIVVYQHEVFEYGGGVAMKSPMHIEGVTLGEPPGPDWVRRLIGDEYFFRVHSVALGPVQINDAGLAAIERLTDLKTLGIDATQLSDADLKYLSRLANLKWLHLNQTGITDDGLLHLKGLTNLEGLDLANTQVTDEGVNRLQQALPNCEISR